MPNQPPFPGKEAELNNYFNTVASYIAANKTRLKISAENAGALEDALLGWNNTYPPSTNAATRTQTITRNKNDAKAAMLAILRSIYADIPQSALTNTDRDTLNIHERKAPTNAPIPTTHPIAEVDTRNRLMHIISFLDDAAAGHSKAKPAGVYGCEVWRKIGSPAPTDLSDCTFVGTYTKSPLEVNYTGADAGKPVYYILRWVNTRNEHGPLSETVMATVTA